MLFYRTRYFGKLPNSFSYKIGSFSSDFGPQKAKNRQKIGSNFEKTQEFQGFERMKFFFMEKAGQKSENKSCSEGGRRFGGLPLIIG